MEESKEKERLCTKESKKKVCAGGARRKERGGEKVGKNKYKRAERTPREPLPFGASISSCMQTISAHLFDN